MTRADEIAADIEARASVDEAMVGASAMGATDELVALAGIARLETIYGYLLPPTTYVTALDVYTARAEQIRNNAVYSARGNA